MSVQFSDSFEAKLDDKRVIQAMRLATKEILYDLYDKCVETSPYRTGKLQESHSWKTQGNAVVAIGLIKNSAKYWSYVEFGTSKMGARRWVRDSIQTIQPVPSFFNYFRSHYHPPK